MNIKSLFSGIVLIVLACFAFGQAPADLIVGKWKTIDDETGDVKSIVRLYKATDGKYYGKIEEILKANDGNLNPDCTECKGKMEKYKTENGKTIGVIFVRALNYNANKKRWSGGYIFDPKKGSEYSCEMWIEGGNLQVKGIHWTGLSRTQTWLPVK